MSSGTITNRSILIWATLVMLLLVVAIARFNAVNANSVTPCVDGMAGEYACHRVDLLAHMPLEALGGSTEQAILANDIWGWTSPDSGKEYALVGLRNATAFVDISDPVNPVYLGSLPATSAWVCQIIATSKCIKIMRLLSPMCRIPITGCRCLI